MARVRKTIRKTILDVKPYLIDEWNFEKNDELGLDIYTLTYSKDKIAWWICPKCKSDYDVMISSRTRAKGAGCPYCCGRRVNHTNCLATINPELASEWHSTKNGDLTPYDIGGGANTLVWWFCSKCKSSFDTEVRYRNRKARSQGCPYCRGLRVNESNSFASLRPKLAKDWHPIKNGELTPDKVLYNSKHRAWWIGECGHEWIVAPYLRLVEGGGSCYECRKFINQSPHLFQYILDKEKEKDVYPYDERKIKWLCNCGNIFKTSVAYVYQRNFLPCPNCSDGKPYPEKVMYHILKQLNISFDIEKKFNWSDNKRYDFYLTDYNMIIETHGGQHYNEASRGKTLIEEQVNDRYKHVMAMHNSIREYIVIDCRKSEIEWIKSNVLKSKLSKIIDLDGIDWEKIAIESEKSIVLEVNDRWNTTRMTVSDLEVEFKISGNSIRKYLNIGVKNGWGTIYPDISRSKRTKAREVVKIDGDNIEVFKNATEAAKVLGINHGNIYTVCNGERNHSGGFKWMYKDEYEEMQKVNNI